jgi:23S rRNA (cytidine1920-2'-O)/16S rRNA (cytidine1409-2'-O)-methyltransferase
MRRRLDAELVRRGLADSRESAQRAIRDHRVLVSGSLADKASRQVDAGEPIRFVGDRPRFVSRGGEKLVGALEHFGIAVNGLDAFDAGASTGGFTDCLLQRGAKSVVAVDVGFGQLHEKIRADARVEVHEHINLRTVDVDAYFSARTFPVLVGDLSFISLTAVADNLLRLAAPGGSLVLLVKPQFEAGRAEVARGRGVVREPEIWRSALERVVNAFSVRGAAMMGVMISSIKGTDGNVEFLAHFLKASEGSSAVSGTGDGPLPNAANEMVVAAVQAAQQRDADLAGSSLADTSNSDDSNALDANANASISDAGHQSTIGSLPLQPKIEDAP